MKGLYGHCKSNVDTYKQGLENARNHYPFVPFYLFSMIDWYARSSRSTTITILSCGLFHANNHWPVRCTGMACSSHSGASAPATAPLAQTRQREDISEQVGRHRGPVLSDLVLEREKEVVRSGWPGKHWRPIGSRYDSLFFPGRESILWRHENRAVRNVWTQVLGRLPYQVIPDIKGGRPSWTAPNGLGT